MKGLECGKFTVKFEGSSYVTDLAHDGADFISALLCDGFARVINLGTGQTVLDKKGAFADPVVGLQVDQNVMYMMSNTGSLCTIDLRDGKEQYTTLARGVGSEEATCCSLSSSSLAYATKQTVTAAGDQADEEEEITMYLADRRCLGRVQSVVKDVHSDAVHSLAFTSRDTHLLSGGADALLNIVDANISGEPASSNLPDANEDALLSTICVTSSVSRCGVISSSLLYATTDDNHWSLLKMNTAEDVDSLFRRPACRDRFLVDVIRTGNDDLPAAAVECDSSGKIFVVGVSEDGKRSTLIGELRGHSEMVRCAVFHSGLLVTGGEDGRLVAFPLDCRSQPKKADKDKTHTRHKPY